jgi:uncharacterized membrane protein YwzB
MVAHLSLHEVVLLTFFFKPCGKNCINIWMCERDEEDPILSFLLTILQFIRKSQFVLFRLTAFNKYLNLNYRIFSSDPTHTICPLTNVVIKCYLLNNGETWQVNSFILNGNTTNTTFVMIILSLIWAYRFLNYKFTYDKYSLHLVSYP